jgi:hypothetical protein
VCESCNQRHKLVGRISDSGWAVIQRIPVVHNKILDKG